MAKRRRRMTLAKKLGVSGARFGRKIRTIKRESPGISNRAAAGKAAGILKPKKARKVMRRRRR